MGDRATAEPAGDRDRAPTRSVVAGSREAWLEAGQDLLRDGGFQAVKLTALSERTGLTTGSFYHHFSGMAPFLDELADYFGGEQPRAVLASIEDLAPRTRLRRLQRLTVEMHMGALHTAMREWAAVSPVAARAVQEADHVLLRFVRDALVDLGADRRTAELRAEIVIALGVARLDTPWARRATSIERVLDAITPTRPS